MKKLESTLANLEEELLGTLHDKCESLSDIQYQEEKLDRINDAINLCSAELQQRRNEIEERKQEIQGQRNMLKIVRCFPNRLSN